MRRLVVAGILLVVAGFALHGQTTQQPFVVQYLDGSVQIQLKGQTRWTTLKEKDKVPADASVKLAKGAMIEMARDKTLIYLIKEGTYPMAGLLSKIETSGPGLGSTVAQKVKTVMSAPAKGKLIQAGARAGCNDDNWDNGGYTREQKLLDEKEKQDWYDAHKNKPLEKGETIPQFEIELLQFFYWGIRGGYAKVQTAQWAEEYENAVDKGIRAILDADYNAAIGYMREAVTRAVLTDEKRRANYLLAVAYVEAGSPVRAWQIISEMTVEKDDWEYGDFLVRKAQLQVDSLLYDDALVTLKPLLDPLSKDEFGQAACLVAYYAYKGLNRNREAADIRQKGLSIVIDCEVDPKVKAETEAERALKGLE